MAAATLAVAVILGVGEPVSAAEPGSDLEVPASVVAILLGDQHLLASASAISPTGAASTTS
ncbi:MAG: hypothetical protein WCI40_02910 [Verrucomicrobiota bacterium]